MKTLSTSLTAALAQAEHTFALCIKITRADDTEYLFTTHDKSLTFGGDTYTSHLLPTDYSINDSGDIDEFGLDIPYELISQDDVEARLLDDARVDLFLVDYSDLPNSHTGTGAAGDIQFVAASKTIVAAAASAWTGFENTKTIKITGASESGNNVITNITAIAGDTLTVAAALTNEDSSTATVIHLSDCIYNRMIAGKPVIRDYDCTIECCSLSKLLQQKVGDLVTPLCNAVFCDSQCTLTESDYTFAGTVATVIAGKTHTEFTATITSPNAAGAVAIVDNYFSRGKVVFTAGNNNGYEMEIEEHDYTAAVHTITLSLPITNAIVIGDTFNAVKGCDKSINACSTELLATNILNYRGFPFVPGMDVASRTPDG